MSSAESDNENRPNISSSSPKQMEESYLLAFDFDHTVVNANSDVKILELSGPVPPEVKKFYDGTNWTSYMNKIFQFLHEQGVSIKEICQLVSNMEATKGMLPLLKALVELKSSPTAPKIHLLIISDANDLFISEFLRAQVLDVSKAISQPNLNDSSPPLEDRTTHQQLPFDIITNMVNNSISSLGPLNNNSHTIPPLQISPYEHQTTCKICPKNLCKGSALQKYIHANGPYTKIFYTGDGGNDVCPAIKLSQGDYVFVRMNHVMHKRLLKSENELGIRANLVLWEDAAEIMNVLKDFLRQL